MIGRKYALIGIAGLTAAAIIPLSLASKSGAIPGASGGPASEATNCAVCHTFGMGPGGVTVSGMPKRYRAGATYDLTIDIHDAEQAGAGFETSVENDAGHQGLLVLTDPEHTHYADNPNVPDYVTHTGAGVNDSIATWVANGGSYQYQLAWTAPGADKGHLTLYAAGNAINDDNNPFGDRYYAGYAMSRFAKPGDADGNGDVDMRDYAVLLDCFDKDVPSSDDPCSYLDFNGDDMVTLLDLPDFIAAMSGPTTRLPGEVVLADVVRGGVLYSKWWKVTGAPAPTGDHPLYPPEGLQSGSATYRCTECHGWDYKGVDGAYGSGSHYTGIEGVFGSTMPPRDMFALLKADPAKVSNGHDMDAYGMTDEDLWDVIRLVTVGTVDTDEYIDESGAFIGDALFGQFRFENICSACHGFDGTNINFGTPEDPEYVGTVAVNNPWEFLHNVRFGHPAAPMPSFELLYWAPGEAASVGAFAATLPTE